MRTIKMALIVLLLPVGFLAGYFVANRPAADNTIQLSSGQKTAAQNAAQLQQKIIEYLQGRYYRAVDVKKLEESGVTGMLKSLNDPWTEYLSPSLVRWFEQDLKGTYSGIGATMEMQGTKMLVKSVFAGSPAQTAGLTAGDQIISVNGRPTSGLSLVANIAHIKGRAGTKVTLVVQPARGGALRTLTLTRKEIAVPLTVHRMLHAGPVPVGYVALSQFADGVGAQVQAAVSDLTAKGAKWIVFDLRDNGGGLLSEAVGVTGDFLKSGVVVSTQGLHSAKQVLDVTGNHATGLPVIVLVNGNTASASEIVSGALQDHKRAILIGTRTFGKGLVQNILALPGGAALKITTAIYLTPDGRNINKLGIKPDRVASDNAKTKADEVVRAALKYIAAQ
jgi:carboxyl-terminal processing protease